MKIGYACINLSLKPTFRTCRVATVEKEGIEKIKELTLQNLELTKAIIQWNIEHNILFYRISSGVVVLATHPVNTWDWKNDPDVQAVCAEIKILKEEHGLRLSVHPGQYSVLNSPREDVVERTIDDLTYHAELLELVGGSDMILHLGGKYGDRQSALERLVRNTQQLPPYVKEKLRFENDDKVFNLEDVLFVANQTEVPACFDIHHHFCNPSEEALEVLLEEVWETWRGKGRPKVHISSGRTHSTDRSHHDYIMPDDFKRLISYVGDTEVDVMVEAKKKNLAVLELMQTFEITPD
ncbi:UV-damage endonuclease [Lentibacillus sp. JNUCC-1]|uniref:UV DNA damage repair endonuclease UvsE n=1 Tax=Lentibacillus sp. JNUCC-1 TaxID=2654513 RepID=UPI0012E8ACD3|nr:UV DNA damage repair endonuclease UvsE [Lentibacillus sp. JNUCC-1]MUV38914.1 UV-damage endonuclease [Lentibacillus sp. JNUCC-1]